MPNRTRVASVRRLRRLWATAAHQTLFIFLLAALAAAPSAHEGHDHDKPPPLNLPVAPRVVAVTPDYELVGVLSGAQRLTIFLHRFATGEPVKGANVAVSSGESEIEATSKEDGVFEMTAPWLAATRPLDLIFRLKLPDDEDILTGRLEKASAAVLAGHPPAVGALWSQLVLYVGVGALMAGILLTLLVSGTLARRRQAAPDQAQDGDAKVDSSRRSNVKRLERASLLIVAALLTGLGFLPDRGWAEPNANLPSVPATMATDMPQRMADGSLFVPKATQHLLSVRTVLTQESQAPRTAQLMGSVVANPNSFGRVQSARPGRSARLPAAVHRGGRQGQHREPDRRGGCPDR